MIKWTEASCANVDDRARMEVADLRRRLAEAEEKNLNAADALIGAEAAAAQARRDIDEIFHRLHIRSEELKELKAMLGYELDTPLEEISKALESESRPGVTVRRHLPSSGSGAKPG